MHPEILLTLIEYGNTGVIDLDLQGDLAISNKDS